MLGLCTINEEFLFFLSLATWYCFWDMTRKLMYYYTYLCERQFCNIAFFFPALRLVRMLRCRSLIINNVTAA